jgi:cytoskeleton protein RodZ
MNDNVRDDAHPTLQPTLGTAATADSQANESAGQLLRAARERSGLHIAALAAALKVPVRKLEALESNRWEELTDATFTRALASSVARHLKTDPASILAALPSHNPVPLVISDGLGKAAPDHKLPTGHSGKPLAWAVALLVLGSVVMYFFPDFWPRETSPGATQVTATVPDSMPTVPPPLEASASASSPDTAATPVNVAVAVDPSKPAEAAPVAQLATSVVVPATASGVAVGGTPPLMVLKASRDTWVEATDNTGRLRIQRVVKSGEEVSFADAVTLSVVIGNAAGAQVEVRGQPMDLASVAKSNIARFEVK